MVHLICILFLSSCTVAWYSLADAFVYSYCDNRLLGDGECVVSVARTGWSGSCHGVIMGTLV